MRVFVQQPHLQPRRCRCAARLFWPRVSDPGGPPLVEEAEVVGAGGFLEHGVDLRVDREAVRPLLARPQIAPVELALHAPQQPERVAVLLLHRRRRYCAGDTHRNRRCAECMQRRMKGPWRARLMKEAYPALADWRVRWPASQRDAGSLSIVSTGVREERKAVRIWNDGRG
eukprot:5308899-Pleurochrysis_carterae.AAC.2